MAYELTWSKPLLYVFYTGVTGDNEVFNATRTAQVAPEFRGIKQILHYLRDQKEFLCKLPEKVDPDKPENHSVITLPDIKIAFVTHRPEVMAMVEAYKDTRLKGCTFQVFATVSEAREWFKK